MKRRKVVRITKEEFELDDGTKMTSCNLVYCLLYLT